jgi:hypothetical protein
MSILAVYREPFSFEPVVARLPEGQTLAEMALRMRGLPDDFDKRGVICINGEAVPRGAWHLVRPLPGRVTEVTFHAPVRGGDDSGKQVFALVASVALMVATGGIAAGAFATSNGLFAAGTMSAKLLAAGVSLVGSLAISALITPPVSTDTSSDDTTLGNASATGNTLAANAAIMRVIGEMKVTPPLVAQPLTEYDGSDEIVEAVYALSGPHQISDIRISDSPIDSVADIEYEVREGWPGDSQLSIVSRIGYTASSQVELTAHTVDTEDGKTLESETSSTSDALPQTQTLSTRHDPDEHQIQMSFPQGISLSAGDTKLRVPLRIKIRQMGADDWINLPELHFQAAAVREIRATIKLIWTDDATTSAGAAGSEGWVEARVSNPAQTASPERDAWSADSYFIGSGDDYMNQNNLGSTGVEHTICDRYTTAFYLDTSVFPQGDYEISIQRGMTFKTSDYSASAYTVSGSVCDLFYYQGDATPKIVQSRNNIADTTYVSRSVSIWNEHPAPTDDLAYVAIRARNRQLGAVTMVAGGYVQDWDGTGWNDWTVTDNPAPHLRSVWLGSQNADPLPNDLANNDELVEWRAACGELGYKCNATIQDKTVDTAATLIASCGYAKPYMSEIWGVFRDYDRSEESPVQIFTSRNMANVSYTRAFARVPDALLCNFADKDRNYDMWQVQIDKPQGGVGSGTVEQVTYEGLTTEEEVTKRAIYDQWQATKRATYYSFDAPVESIVCRRGSLVGFNTDMLTEHHGSARVAAAEFDESGDITALVLDCTVPMVNEPSWADITDMNDVEDMTLIGVSSGICIRGKNTINIYAASNETGETDTVTFDTPISSTGLVDSYGDPIDALISVGPLGQEYLRGIVYSITPKEDLTASITLVDEASELFA